VGRSENALFRIEFGLVDRIRRGRLSGATVYLIDGRSFDLDGTTDVSWDSYGVFVSDAPRGDGATESGPWRLVTWDELAEVRFETAPGADTAETGSGNGR